jgi:hypothetical protein
VGLRGDVELSQVCIVPAAAGLENRDRALHLGAPPEVLQEHDIVERCEMSYSDMRAGAEELGDLMGHHHADVRSGAALYLGILPAQDRRHRSRPSAGARLRQEDPTEPVWDRQASAVTA